MKTQVKLSLLLTLLTASLFAQERSMPLKEVGELDRKLEECSGISLLPDGRLVMINDSGNHPDLYFTNKRGKILSKRCLLEASNHDWEELTFHEGVLYIGDFGNNKNRRKDLCIYKYHWNEGDSLYLEGKINFKYSDQRLFPPLFEQRNYDLEAMVVLNDSIFIFTKNRTQPFSGHTYLYGLPTKPGDYTIGRLDSFKTGPGPDEEYWISGAALNTDNSVLALLGYERVWIFEGFPGRRFFSGDVRVFKFESLSQKEALTFDTNGDLILTDELNHMGGGKVYRGSIPGFMAAKTHQVKPELSVEKQFEKTIQVDIVTAEPLKLLWEIYSTSGRRVLAGKAEFDVGQHQLDIDAENLEPGGYVLNVIVNGKPHAFKLKKYYPLKKDKAQ